MKWWRKWQAQRRARRWRESFKPWALRVHFIPQMGRLYEFDDEVKMWTEFDRMVSGPRPMGDLISMEAIHEGTVIGRWPK